MHDSSIAEKPGNRSSIYSKEVTKPQIPRTEFANHNKITCHFHAFVLQKNDQELAFEPIDFGYIENGKSNKGTVAGYLSCNYAGSRRFKVGSVRDHVLGFKAVNGKGDVFKSGGTVVKNVTGYDLSKLVSGSFGTLCVLTEITLKVLPKKKFSNTMVIDVKDNKKIYELFDKISSSSSEVSGAVFVPEEPDDENYLKSRDRIFKFNDLDFKGSFLAFRVELWCC